MQQTHFVCAYLERDRQTDLHKDGNQVQDGCKNGAQLRGRFIFYLHFVFVFFFAQYCIWVYLQFIFVLCEYLQKYFVPLENRKSCVLWVRCVFYFYILSDWRISKTIYNIISSIHYRLCSYPLVCSNLWHQVFNLYNDGIILNSFFITIMAIIQTSQTILLSISSSTYT